MLQYALLRKLPPLHPSPLPWPIHNAYNHDPLELEDCHLCQRPLWLHALFDTCCACCMQVASISKFEGKGPIGLPGGDSVKGHHLLPFLPAFTAFVTRLQELLVGMTLHWSLLSGHWKAGCAV